MSNKVLFVDDEPHILAAFERMFRGEFEIETAVGAEAGLRSIRDRGPFGVVISDIEMPGMNGIQFLARVRQIAPDSARLILTGRAEVKTLINAINDGRVFEFLTKPCSRDALAKAITSALAERDRRRAPRARIQLPVRLFRSCTGEKSQTAHTLDISASGVRLAGLKEPLKRGEVIDIQCGKRKAPFQVAWIGSTGTATAEQAGVECLAPEGNIWELNLLPPSEEPLLREITLARTVQSRLFPQEKPILQTLDYSGHCIPARVVGGDYYDFLDMRPGEVGFVVADIAGKGVAAALLMANLQGVLHSNLSIASKDLTRWLASVNRHFHKHTNNHDYATLFLGCYSDASRKLRYVNCGHNPPLLLRHSGIVEKLDATATVLGLFDRWDGSVAETELAVGDILTIYTDGAIEATNQQGEEFGEPRFLEVLRGNWDREADSMLRNVEQAVQQFAAGEPGDDVTLLITRAR